MCPGCSKLTNVSKIVQKCPLDTVQAVKIVKQVLSLKKFQRKLFFGTPCRKYTTQNIQGAFFYWSALKMTKYEEKLKYLNWSANCSSRKVLSVNSQQIFTEKIKVF